jgi:hypothetical protein
MEFKISSVFSLAMIAVCLAATNAPEGRGKADTSGTQPRHDAPFVSIENAAHDRPAPRPSNARPQVPAIPAVELIDVAKPAFDWQRAGDALGRLRRSLGARIIEPSLELAVGHRAQDEAVCGGSDLGDLCNLAAAFDAEKLFTLAGGTFLANIGEQFGAGNRQDGANALVSPCEHAASDAVIEAGANGAGSIAGEANDLFAGYEAGAPYDRCESGHDCSVSLSTEREAP